ncbi:MAG TPA: hypothetical protein VK117_04795 [Pyrinomonadaceae bacterium]|nr:hypothetical protein [Pyrinomonadaceae bacterium]
MKTEIELIMRDGAAEERAGAANSAPQTDVIRGTDKLAIEVMPEESQNRDN